MPPHLHDHDKEKSPYGPNNTVLEYPPKVSLRKEAQTRCELLQQTNSGKSSMFCNNSTCSGIGGDAPEYAEYGGE
jgi:hypothetical protein